MSFFKGTSEHSSKKSDVFIPEEFLEGDEKNLEVNTLDDEESNEEMEDVMVDTLMEESSESSEKDEENEEDEEINEEDSDQIGELLDSLMETEENEEGEETQSESPLEELIKMYKEETKDEVNNQRNQASENNKKVKDNKEDKDMADENYKKEIDNILSSLEDIENGKEDIGFEKAFNDKGTRFSLSEQREEKISDEVSVISKGTTVGGGISASGSLEIYGSVNGDVECRGKLTILGDVTGNASAAEIFINTSRFEGDIRSKGAVNVGVGTVVIGDVTGTNAIIAGAIKGEVDVTGPVILDSTAVIKGNVKAKSVQVNNGAVLQGFCSLVYSDVDIDDFFEAEEFK